MDLKSRQRVFDPSVRPVSDRRSGTRYRVALLTHPCPVWCDHVFSPPVDIINTHAMPTQLATVVNSPREAAQARPSPDCRIVSEDPGQHLVGS
jgi:hypothetical protein